MLANVPFVEQIMLFVLLPFLLRERKQASGAALGTEKGKGL